MLPNADCVILRGGEKVWLDQCQWLQVVDGQCHVDLLFFLSFWPGKHWEYFIQGTVHAWYFLIPSFSLYVLCWWCFVFFHFFSFSPKGFFVVAAGFLQAIKTFNQFSSSEFLFGAFPSPVLLYHMTDVYSCQWELFNFRQLSFLCHLFFI